MGRGKRLRKLLAAAGMGICMMSGTVLADCDLEQISIRMPQVKVYYRADQPETSYEAYLGGEALTYDSTEIFRETGSGVDYYLMLDVSASIPDAQFENLKAGIQEFISTNGNNRPKTLTFQMGTQSWEVEFPDAWQEFGLEFTHPVPTSNMKITINEVYKGKSWDDTVIADINIWY